MEASLAVAAEREPAVRAALFDRFFERYPERREIFILVERTSVRMTSETFQWMLGITGGEGWVWGQVAELTFQHRTYGRLSHEEYTSFVDLAIDALGEFAGEAWTASCAEAWRAAAAQLKKMLHRAMEEWTASPLPYP